MELIGGPDTTARAKNANGGSEPLDVFNQLAAAHRRHDEISEQKVNLSFGPIQQIEGFLAAVGGKNAVTVSGENRLAHRQKKVFVVHHQNHFGASEIAGWDSVVFDDPFLSRQIDAHGCAGADLAGNSDAAAVIGDDSINPCQTQATMFLVFFGGKKWLENAWQNFGLDTATVVRHFRADISARRQMNRSVLGCLTELNVAGLDGDAALVANGLDGVFDDTNENLLHLQLVETRGEGIALELERPGDEFGGWIFLKEFHAMLEDNIEVTAGLGVGILFLAAEGAEVIGDFGSAGGGFFDFQQRSAPGVIWLDLAEKVGGVAENAGEGVIEIQRDGPRELQGAVQFLLVPQVGFGHPVFRIRSGTLGKQLQQHIFSAIHCYRASRREIRSRRTVFDDDSNRHERRGRGALGLREELRQRI